MVERLRRAASAAGAAVGFEGACFAGAPHGEIGRERQLIYENTIFRLEKNASRSFQFGAGASMWSRRKSPCLTAR